jgi:hypothetical protein
MLFKNRFPDIFVHTEMSVLAVLSKHSFLAVLLKHSLLAVLSKPPLHECPVLFSLSFNSCHFIGNKDNPL